MRQSIVAAALFGLTLAGCSHPVLTAAGAGIVAGAVAANHGILDRNRKCYAVDLNGNDLYINRLGRVVSYRTDTRLLVDC